MNDDDLKFYTTDEVAKMLGVTRMTIHRYIKAGKLECFKLSDRLIRISKADIDKFVKTNARK